MFGKVKVYFDWYQTWKAWPVLAWIKGADLYRSCDFHAAAAKYQYGLERYAEHPANFCARLDLSYCLFRLSRFSEAEEQLKFIMTHRPNIREAYLRFARLKIWVGQPMEAAWTIRRAIRNFGADAELVATFLFALLDNHGPAYLIKDALSELRKLPAAEKQDQRIEIALSRLAVYRGDVKTGKASLSKLANGLEAPFDAVLNLAELFLNEDRVAQARQQLRRALMVAPNHPRVLSLFAASYLKGGAYYNPEFAVQLAQSACQASGWLSPRELHVLAESYYSHGDRLSALNAALKAKAAGSKLLGHYSDVRSIDKLIEALSST